MSPLSSRPSRRHLRALRAARRRAGVSRPGRSLLLGAALTGVLGLPASSGAAPLQPTTRIVGPTGQSYPSGGNVNPAGDVNGDGLADVLVSAVEGLRVFVVLGTRTPTNLDLPASGGAAFELSDGRGKLIASPAGDVDGDGLADILVRSTESKWIAYGGRDVRDIKLDTTGSDPRVTFIKAPMGNGGYGPFRTAGDFDGDGKDDVLITRGPDVAIMFGGPRVPVFDATGTGTRIAKITGIKRCTWIYGFIYTCFTVVNDPVPIGDVNGDGKDDLFQPENKFITLGRSGNATLTSTIESTATRFTNFGTGYYLDTDLAVPDHFGDLTGDGIDDLVLLKNGNTANHRYLVIPGSPALPRSIDVLTYPSITIADDGRTFGLRPAGDLSGDGRPELVASTRDGLRTLSVPTTVPAAVAVSSGSAIPAVPQDPNQQYPDLGSAVGVGDTDGDGQRDLAFGAPFFRGGSAFGAVFLISSGADQIPPELAAKSLSDPDDTSFSQVTPKRFAAGTAATLRLNLLEAADVELIYRKASGGPALSTERRSLPRGVTDTSWDGLGKGVDGVPGDYVIEATPIDAAGNRGQTKSLAFELTDGSAAVPATIEWTNREEAAPAGITPPARFSWTPEMGGTCGTSSFNTQQERWDADAPSAPFAIEIYQPPVAGEVCELSINAPADTDSVQTMLTAETYPWRSLVSINGGPSVDVTAFGVSEYRALKIPPFKLVRGKNTVVVTQRWDSARVPVIDETTNVWYRPSVSAGPANAAQSLPNGAGLELTPAKTFQRGFVNDRTHPLDARRVKVDFDAVLEGAANGGNGLAFNVFTGYGYGLVNNTGAGLGFLGSIGKSGTSVVLSTFKGTRNPSANFVGIASSATASTTGYPIWLQTADPGKTLAAATTHVTITSKDGVVMVELDGVERLRRTMTLPSTASWGFSAATGNAVQRHLIKNLRVVTA